MTFLKTFFSILTSEMKSAGIKKSFILCSSRSGQNSITAELYNVTE